MANTPIYPNSPLVEVVFEIRFNGIPAIECHRDKFYEQVRQVYPKVFVPAVKDGDFPALKAQRYAKEDESAAVLHAINSFALSSKDYSGHAAFKSEFLRLLGVFDGLFKIGNLNRAGWRYINVIPYAKVGDIIPLAQFFNFDLGLPLGSSEYENLNMVLTTKIEKAHVIFRLQAMETQDGQQVLLLDIDYSKTQDLTLNGASQYLDEGHLRAKDVFERLITEQYRQYLRGEIE